MNKFLGKKTSWNVKNIILLQMKFDSINLEEAANKMFYIK